MLLILQLLLLYYTGQAFSRLAGKYERNIYLYALVGPAVLFLLQQCSLFGINILVAFEYINNISVLYYGLISIGGAIILTYFLYEYLERKWKYPKKVVSDDILDDF